MLHVVVRWSFPKIKTLWSLLFLRNKKIYHINCICQHFSLNRLTPTCQRIPQFFQSHAVVGLIDTFSQHFAPTLIYHHPPPLIYFFHWVCWLSLRRCTYSRIDSHHVSIIIVIGKSLSRRLNGSIWHYVFHHRAQRGISVQDPMMTKWYTSEDGGDIHARLISLSR